MELKTLKDMETYSFGIDGHKCEVCNLCVGGHELNYCDCEGIEIKSLKQEAVKHLKNVEYDEKLKMHYIQVGEFRYGFIAWIKHFFNIMESNLNE